MDERAIKRLLIILAASLIAIWIFKTMLSKTIVNLNKAAVEKKQATKLPATQEATPPFFDATAIVPETPAASAVGAVTMMEPSAASSVSETR